MSDFDDRYGRDVLEGFAASRRRSKPKSCGASEGLIVEHIASGFSGAVVRIEAGNVLLEDWKARVRAFPLGEGFLVDGVPVTLERPTPAAAAQGNPPAAPRRRTASGSFATDRRRARVARASRILVEGRHDAELVEKVWGDDLREEGVVVEYLGGIDDLPAMLDELGPTREKKFGVLVDHLVPGSKEQHIADAVHSGPHRDTVLVVGHPFVDVWQSVKPERVGLREWPTIPRSIEWKVGICQALGLPHENQADIARAWQKILGTVLTYRDLEPALLGRVEELIDFVTAP